MFITAAAELKFMFVVFILLLVGAALLTRYSWRKMLLLCVAALILIMGMNLATSLFEYRDVFTWESLWNFATKDNYSTTGDVNRLSAISNLQKSVISNPIEQIFGLGLGNCDTSAFSVCNSAFYRQYGHMHYTWIMSAMLFLETGYVGMGIYFLFLLSCGWCTYKQYKKHEGDKIDNQIALLIAALCLPLVFYNSCLRTETAYMIYMVLAVPFIQSKTGKERV